MVLFFLEDAYHNTYNLVIGNWDKTNEVDKYSLKDVRLVGTGIKADVYGRTYLAPVCFSPLIGGFSMPRVDVSYVVVSPEYEEQVMDFITAQEKSRKIG